MKRRTLLTFPAAALAAGADGLPRVTDPRATSGDHVEPAWKESVTITVGQKSGDIVGSTERAIQAAVDSVARWGGGTVKILPGSYRFRNAVYLQSKVRITGSGLDSVLVKEPSVKSALAADSDWYDQEITLADPAGFRIGDGVCLRAKNTHNNSNIVIKRTLVARNGNRFKLDRALRENTWLPGSPTAATLFPLFSGENIHGVRIDDLTFDGNKANNEELDGNYAGCIFLQDCHSIQIRRVTARNYRGDGISWQICHDVVVEDCHSHDNTGLGLHPGSGSQRPLVRGNRLVANDQGLFFCWGVKYGLAEKNTIEDNRRYGISIGHRDTDNIIRDNDIRRSGEVGILFRKERGLAYNAHRNRVEGNRIVDIAKQGGVGIDVQGQTGQIQIRSNEIRHTAVSDTRVGVRIGAEAGEVTLAANRIEGFSQAVQDLRKKNA
jgi:hypothetical protein